MKLPEHRFITKICGITNEADAHWAAECGATAIGFNFYRKSPRYIEPAAAGNIRKSLPAAVLSVGIFVNTSPAEILEVVKSASLDVVQVHGSFQGAQEQLGGARLWRSVPMGSSAPIEQDAELLVLDTPTREYGGSGKVFDWKLTGAFRQPFIIAGGLDSSNVAEAIKVTRAVGVDACSRLESAPGRKDPILVKKFLTNALRAAALREPQEITQ